MIDFYTPFLTALHDKVGGQISIFGHALTGHTPDIEQPSTFVSTSLTAQLDGAVEIVDAVKSTHTTIVIAGHSVGSWIALQVFFLQRFYSHWQSQRMYRY